MDMEVIKELFKLVSSLDYDWNGNENSRTNLVRFLTNNQELISDGYIKTAYDCVAQYDEVKLHLLRHQLISEILVEENKEKRKYFVFKHTSPNGKVYIGITCCESVELRWYGGWGYRQNHAFYEDIKKFGWENIVHEILYQDLSPKDARRIEVELIEQYKAMDPRYGYNLDDGGRITTTPYIWKTWTYDIHYQDRAKRRPFKVIVDTNDLKKFEKYVSKFSGEIIACIPMDEFADQYFVVASNPSYKEKQVRETIKQYFDNNGGSLNVEYLYGAVDGLPFEMDAVNQKLIVRLYVIDKRDYKLENVLEDLQKVLNVKRKIACVEHDFSDLIRDFGTFTFFYPVFELYEGRGQVGRCKQIIFEIRTKEQGHNTPHIHAHYENENISISLVDFTILAGNIPSKQKNLAVRWVEEHIDFLRSKWNEYHRYTIPVLGGKCSESID